MFLFKAPFNLLTDPEQTELSFREDFVNPIIAKIFDDVMDLIRVKTCVWVYSYFKDFSLIQSLSSCSGEIENVSCKSQRNETRQYKQRVQIGCSQDGIYKISINATVFEIGFLEVIGNAIHTDITKLNEDTEKVLKWIRFS